MQPKVALLIETARGYGRQVLMGVAKYSRLHGPWSFHITPGDFEQAAPDPGDWAGDGVIARIATPRIERALIDAAAPTVALGLTEAQLASGHPASRFSELRTDSVEAARLAAEHLLERRFSHYAYVGIADRVWSQRREAAYRARLAEAGFEPIVYDPPTKRADRAWGRERERLAEWITALPRPVGLMACNDDRGREVLDACALAGVAVPEDVAVIGVDDDEVFCELSNPPLSSVAWNGIRAGFRAAQTLDALMKDPGREPVRLTTDALRVVTRRSTDIIALDDRDVAAALQFIHDRRGRGISVDDIADHAAVSRRYLETRFREEVGRTVLGEVQRVRLEHAKRLLQETDHAIPKIADLSGYSSASYLIQVFRQHFGMTPAKYRNSLGE